jgi:hypothetical protein
MDGGSEGGWSVGDDLGVGAEWWMRWANVFVLRFDLHHFSFYPNYLFTASLFYIS